MAFSISPKGLLSFLPKMKLDLLVICSSTSFQNILIIHLLHFHQQKYLLQRFLLNLCLCWGQLDCEYFPHLFNILSYYNHLLLKRFILNFGFHQLNHHVSFDFLFFNLFMIKLSHGLPSNSAFKYIANPSVTLPIHSLLFRIVDFHFQ